MQLLGCLCALNPPFSLGSLGTKRLYYCFFFFGGGGGGGGGDGGLLGGGGRYPFH